MAKALLSLKIDATEAQKQSDDLKISLAALGDEGEEARLKAAALGETLDENAKLLENSANAAKKTTNVFDKMAESFASSEGQLAFFSGTLLVFVGGIALATKANIEFQEGLANVATLIPNQRDRVKELGEEVIKLSLITGKTTTDLNEGLFQVVSAFGDTVDSVATLDLVSRAAAAGLSTTTDALNLISAVTKGYGDTSLKAQKDVSDFALLTVRLGQTTFPELASAIGRVTASSSILNISQKELFASFATLTGAIGNTAEVSTSLKAVNTALLKPTKEMQVLLTGIGFASGQAAIESLGFQGTLKALLKETDNNATAFQKALSSTEAFGAAIVLAKDEIGKYNQSLNAMNNASGTTEAAFKEQTEGVNKLGFELQRGARLFDALLIKVGQEVAPAFAKFTEIAIDTVTSLSKMGITLEDTGTAIVTFGGVVSTIAVLNISSLALQSNIATKSLAALRIAMGSTALVGATLGGALTAVISPLAFTAVVLASVGVGYVVLKKRIRETMFAIKNSEKAIKEQANITKQLISIQDEEINILKEKEKAVTSLSKATDEARTKRSEGDTATKKDSSLTQVKFGPGDKDFLKEQTDILNKLEIEAKAIDLVKNSQFGLNEAKLRATQIILGKTKLTQKENELALLNAQAIDEQSKATNALKEAVKKATDEATKAKDAKEKLTESVKDEISTLDAERKAILNNIAALGDSEKATIGVAQAKALLTTAGGEFKDAENAAKAAIIEGSIALDEANKKLEEKQALLKDQSSIDDFITKLREENQALKDEANEINISVLSKKEFEKATQGQIQAIRQLEQEQQALKIKAVIAALDEEIKNQNLSKEALREKTIIQKLGNEATNEQINQVKKLLELEKSQAAIRTLEDLEKELSLQKLSNEERKETIALSALGLSKASEENKSKALFLKEEIEKQKELNKIKEESADAEIKKAEAIGKTIDALREELAIQKLSTKEREKQLLLVELGLSEATRSQQIEALALKDQIEKQKELREEVEKTAEAAKKQEEQKAAIAQALLGGTDATFFDQLLESAKSARSALEQLNEQRVDAALISQELTASEKENSDNLITTFIDRRKAQLEAEGIEKESLSNRIDTLREWGDESLGIIKTFRDLSSKISDDIKGITIQEIPLGQITENIEQGLKALSEAGKKGAVDIDALEDLRELTLRRFEAEKKAIKENAEERLDFLLEERKISQSNFEAFTSLSSGLRDTVDSLLVGDKSILSGEEKISLIQKKFQESAALAEKGDIDASGKLSSQGKLLIDLASEQFKTSPAFEEIFNAVTETLGRVAGFAEEKATEALTQEQALSKQIEQQEQNLDLQAEIAEAQKSASNTLIELRDLIAEQNQIQTENLIRAVSGIEKLVSTIKKQSETQTKDSDQRFFNAVT